MYTLQYIQRPRPFGGGGESGNEHRLEIVSMDHIAFLNRYAEKYNRCDDELLIYLVQSERVTP